MKKFIAVLCLVLVMCSFTFVVANAEETPTEATITETTTESTTTETTSPAEETIPEKTFSEKVVDWVKANFTDLSVVAALLLSIFYEIRKHGKLSGSVNTLNNNAIAIANNNAETIKLAFERVEELAKVVEKYKDDFTAIFDEVRKTAEEKQTLEATLTHVETFLKSAKLATLELSNEVAELLVLANIPVSKKDELYARHTKAVHELEAVEEVMSNERIEA